MKYTELKRRLENWEPASDTDLIYIFHYERWVLGLSEDKISIKLMVPKNPENTEDFELKPTSFVQFAGFIKEENEDKEKVLCIIFLHPKHNTNLLFARSVIRHELYHIFRRDLFRPNKFYSVTKKIYDRFWAETSCFAYEGRFEPFVKIVFIFLLTLLVSNNFALLLLTVEYYPYNLLLLSFYLLAIFFTIWLKDVLPRKG